MGAPIGIREAGAADEQDWNAFVSSRPEATPCHLVQWRRTIENSYRGRTRYLLAERDAGVVGVLPLVEMTDLSGSRRAVSLPFLDQGGPLSVDEEARDALVQAALAAGRARRLEGLELRCEMPGNEVESPRRVRVVLRLPETAEELWTRIGSKVRNLIRKAEKSGVRACEEAPPAALIPFYRVFSRNMRDLGSPTHSRRWFSEIFRSFGPQAKLFLSRDTDGKCVAGGVAVAFRDTMVVPWASSLRSARPLAANYALYWEMLRQGVEHGVRSFDFGRSALGSGTLHFKKQWNGDVVPLHWSSLGPNGEPLPERGLHPDRHRHLATLWSWLPLPVANWLGPMLRRRIPL